MSQPRRFLFGLLLLPASVASAHPGHGSDGGSHELVHYLSDPLHLGVLVSVIAIPVAAAMVWRLVRSQPADAEKS